MENDGIFVFESDGNRGEFISRLGAEPHTDRDRYTPFIDLKLLRSVLVSLSGVNGFLYACDELGIKSDDAIRRIAGLSSYMGRMAEGGKPYNGQVDGWDKTKMDVIVYHVDSLFHPMSSLEDWYSGDSTETREAITRILGDMCTKMIIDGVVYDAYAEVNDSHKGSGWLAVSVYVALSPKNEYLRIMRWHKL
jgi:hypothetical protein